MHPRHRLELSALSAPPSRLMRDESGNVIIYVSLTAAAILGLVGLALDGARAMITHSEAQAAADAAALAGASQLDQQPGACGRAKAEAAAVVNGQRFAKGGPAPINVAAGGAVCLSGLPSGDAASTAGFVTTDDAAAQYIQVSTEQLTHQNTFLNAVSPSNSTATVQRTAVAGFRRSLCAPMPIMMMCDTATWTAGVAFDAWANDAQHKGFLSACGNSANCVKDTLASVQPSFCVVDNSIEPVPGNKTAKAEDGLNTRMGIGSTSTYPSDTDVVDFTDWSNDIGGGSGWNCAGYWSANHAADGLPKPTGCTANATAVTRYSVYQTERAQKKIPAAGQPPKNTPTTADERRLMYLAIFNCSGGTAPEAFVKAFMLAPAQGKSAKTVYVEPLGLATSKTDPTAIHEEVQLYR